MGAVSITSRLRTAGQRVAARAGRRGAFLAFLAVLDFLYGYSLFTSPAPLRNLDLLLPWQAWAWMWIAAGVIMASGIPARRDRVQYAISAAFKTTWALLYAQLWFVQHVPRAWVAAIIWAAFAATVLIISGWPEPPPKHGVPAPLEGTPAVIAPAGPPEKGPPRPGTPVVIIPAEPQHGEGS